MIKLIIDRVVAGLGANVSHLTRKRKTDEPFLLFISYGRKNQQSVKQIKRSDVAFFLSLQTGRTGLTFHSTNNITQTCLGHIRLIVNGQSDYSYIQSHKMISC